MKNIHLFLSIFILVISSFAVSCQKEGPANCVIEVITEDKKPVSGAKVYLHAKDAMPTPGEFEQEGITDASGKASFTFKLEAIYTVEASKGDSINGSYYGMGSVRLEQKKTVNQTVVVRPVI
jgi:hypothetical protein